MAAGRAIGSCLKRKLYIGHADCLAGWQDAWLAAWLGGRLAAWLASWLAGWLVACLAGWLAG